MEIFKRHPWKNLSQTRILSSCICSRRTVAFTALHAIVAVLIIKKGSPQDFSRTNSRGNQTRRIQLSLKIYSIEIRYDIRYPRKKLNKRPDAHMLNYKICSHPRSVIISRSAIFIPKPNKNTVKKTS
ncbi:PREDICTED: uncharacterized protein LOC105454720 [Wasmannia auropunctata]|uniref:uncharacterized protein LOC105454720 n=1 Tax=Wasmannia auropunctata TaxID=64793 RepID=UPI0005EFA581|nr:PREDICTED: uncharacterized protein LOC105454720 [Wasmannia auropunctata]